MSLHIPSQGHRDDGAAAFDLTTAGFSVKTRLKLEPGRRVEFRMQIPGRRVISGAARIAWTYPLRGRQIGGAEIIKISKRDALALRLAVDPHGTSALRVAGNTLAGIICGLAVLAVESLMRGEPPPEGPARFYPYIGAAGLAACVGLFLYFRLSDRRG